MTPPFASDLAFGTFLIGGPGREPHPLTRDESDRRMVAEVLGCTVTHGSRVESEHCPPRAGFECECVDAEPNINLDAFLRLAEYFGTKRIDVDGWQRGGGCPTCDFGERTSFVLTVLWEEA